jgi:hypothetical protein
MQPSIEFLLNILIPSIVAVIASFIAIRLLPYDVDTRKSTTIKNLFETVDKLVEDLRIANIKIAEQSEKIYALENRKAVTLKAQH